LILIFSNVHKLYFLLSLCITTLACAQEEKILRLNMFDDLQVTNSVTKSYRDSAYTFHVKVLKDQEDGLLVRRYYWFHQGEVMSTVGNYSGKLLHGVFEKFDRDGRLLEKGTFDNGLKTGLWTTWHFNGNLAIQRHWSKGWRTNEFTEYYDNGAVKRKGGYKSDVLHGRLYTYSINGELLSKEKYKRGKLVKAKVKKINKRKEKRLAKAKTTDLQMKDGNVQKTSKKWSLFKRKDKNEPSVTATNPSTVNKAQGEKNSKPSRSEKRAAKKKQKMEQQTPAEQTQKK
jgi:antitoxin component YwqK of YwqJK toxin-antitoxin module